MIIYQIIAKWPEFEFLEKSADVAVYFWIGAVSSGLFLIKLLLTLIGGDDPGDFDIGDDIGDIGSDASFTAFSLLSILAFFMGAGWMGVACRLDWDLGSTVSLLISTGSGMCMMFLSSGLMFYVKRFNREVRYEPKTCVGKTALVYLTIPSKGNGRGQVRIDVSGRKKILSAQTNSSEKLKAFSAIKVVEVLDDNTLVVESAE